MPVLNTGLATPSRGGFTLDQSLRFEDGDSPYLSFTPSTSNRQISTWSGWLKFGNIKTADHPKVISWGTGGTELNIYFIGNNIQVAEWTGGAYRFNLVANAKYRDPSAWYHLVVAFDTTQSTASNRIKLYINGSQVTSFSTEDYPAEDYNTLMNSSTVMQLGVQSGAGDYYDGYMAEVHFIDGTALTPTSFGETGDYGEWKPIEVSGLTYGTNGFYLSFAGGGVMSATGGTITTDGDYKVNSFTADATFTPSADGYVEYLVIGGGGAGAGASNAAVYGGSGGGGAGGYRTGYLAVTGGTGYSIVVGAGGVGRTYAASGTGNTGADSIFSSITSGGGGGGCGYGAVAATMADASAGGAMGKSDGSSSAAGGSTAYGNAGGAGGGTGTANATAYGAGGGGGSGAVGANGSGSAGGNGGAGTASSITGSSVTRAGGGGGGTYNGVGTLGSGGSGGGGGASHTTGTAGTANTGGGGGASNVAANSGAAGGSGIVIIRYKFQ